MWKISSPGKLQHGFIFVPISHRELCFCRQDVSTVHRSPKQYGKLYMPRSLTLVFNGKKKISRRHIPFEDWLKDIHVFVFGTNLFTVVKDSLDSRGHNATTSGINFSVST